MMRFFEMNSRGSKWMFLICLALVHAASADDAAIKSRVIEREKATLQAWKTHDKKAYKDLCLPGFYEITSSGSVNNLEDQLKSLDDYTLGDYQMTDVAVTLVSETTALIRYKIRAHYSHKGKELPEDYMMASAVWILHGDEWKAATYQEVNLH
jgi:hypothetical protein